MAVKKINVLIFPAGSEIGLEIYNSLKYNLHVELFGASGKSDHAVYVYDKDHYIEDDFYIGKENFIETFNKMLETLAIDVIFPTHDSIVLFLAKNQDRLKAKVLTSSYETTLIAREKKRTYDLFKEFDFCPQVYTPPFPNIVFPAFLKPDQGQGGKGTYIVHSREELQERISENPDLIACEYLPGDEFSIDCFSDRKGQLLFVGPRIRSRIEIGISFRTSSVPLNDTIRKIAEILNEKLSFRGAWFFQLKTDRNGNYKLMEFAARQASTMGLFRQLGVNFALLSIFDIMDMDVKVLCNEYGIELDRCLKNSYKLDLKYDHVYIDFDDTIIVNEKVNAVALQYLYQCKNNQIHISLLTKHIYDLDESLNKYCIAKNLFTEIILIKPDDEKVKYIKSEKAIFIDNYFFDRKKIKEELNIPVFDVDAIESLLN